MYIFGRYKYNSNVVYIVSYISYEQFQAIYKNARKYKLIKKKKKEKDAPQITKLIKQFIALTLLPPEKIAEGFTLIEEHCKTNFPNNSKITKFLDYYKKQWLPHPQNFSVYREIDRTNNAVESYHRTINSMMRKSPGLNKFFGNVYIIYIY